MERVYANTIYCWCNFLRRTTIHLGCGQWNQSIKLNQNRFLAKWRPWKKKHEKTGTNKSQTVGHQLVHAPLPSQLWFLWDFIWHMLVISIWDRRYTVFVIMYSIIIIEKIEDARSGLNSELIKKRSLTINNLLNELSTASLQSSTG